MALMSRFLSQAVIAQDVPLSSYSIGSSPWILVQSRIAFTMWSAGNRLTILRYGVRSAMARFTYRCFPSKSA